MRSDLSARQRKQALRRRRTREHRARLFIVAILAPVPPRLVADLAAWRLCPRWLVKALGTVTRWTSPDVAVAAWLNPRLEEHVAILLVREASNRQGMWRSGHGGRAADLTAQACLHAYRECQRDPAIGGRQWLWRSLLRPWPTYAGRNPVAEKLLQYPSLPTPLMVEIWREAVEPPRAGARPQHEPSSVSDIALASARRLVGAPDCPPAVLEWAAHHRLSLVRRVVIDCRDTPEEYRVIAALGMGAQQ